MASSEGSVPPYFERGTTRAAILGSFVVVFLPLVTLQLVAADEPWVTWLTLVEVVGLGVTHFFITLAVYFQSANVDHFESTRRNRIVYFVVPIALFLLFAGLAAGDVRHRHPAFAAAFFGCVRLFDFFHVGRQSFGMLQIFKRPLGAAAPEWLRAAENTFFVAMAALQWETFVVGGRFAHGALYAWLPAGALAVSSVVITAAYVRALAGAPRTAWAPLVYFAMQAICAATAVWRSDLYLVALTLHYVEYHAIMLPRCLRTPLDPTRALDRGFARVRRRPWLFYGTLLAVVLLFEQREAITFASPATRFIVHAFDGIFVVHYFLEAFLWKFREPYFRRTLAPLYFPTVAPGPASAALASERGAGA